MRISFAKWGNSLALRIPSRVARELGVREGTAVDVNIRNGRLVVQPAAPAYRLSDLVAGITRRNRHSEMDAGGAVGAEVID